MAAALLALVKESNITLQIGRSSVPGFLLIPTGPGPWPAALLLHGFNSRKEDMAHSIGRALRRGGVASLAIDLPLHGARVERLSEASLRNPLTLAAKWREALTDCRGALHYLRQQPEIDAHRLAVVGFSMGSFLGALAAASDPDVRALVIAAGGDLPTPTPFERLVRRVADPLRAVRKLAGRPLLMVHGTRDRTVTPDQARRLFEAAGEPREIRWYPAGHWLPDRAIEDAAAWLAGRLASSDASAAAARESRGGSRARG